MKKILYIDMDNVLVDFASGIEKLSDELKKEFEYDLSDAPGIFSLMEPMEGAVEAHRELSSLFETYILSTAPWKNPSAWSDKLIWVKNYLGVPAYKRLILSHHKHLNIGHFLVDDRLKNGVENFKGFHIHFGTANNKTPINFNRPPSTTPSASSGTPTASLPPCKTPWAAANTTATTAPSA